MRTNTQTKIKNTILTIIALVSGLVMASEVQSLGYSWIQILAAVIFCSVVFIAVGGKRDGKIS